MPKKLEGYRSGRGRLFWGLPPLILFFNMSIGWFGRFVLSTIVNQNKEAWLQESKLAKMLCMVGANRWEILPKVNT